MELPPLDKDVPEYPYNPVESLWNKTPGAPWYEVRRENIPYWLGLAAILLVILLFRYRRYRKKRNRKENLDRLLHHIQHKARQAGLSTAEEEALLAAVRKLHTSMPPEAVLTYGFYDTYLRENILMNQGEEMEKEIRTKLFGNEDDEGNVS